MPIGFVLVAPVVFALQVAIGVLLFRQAVMGDLVRFGVPVAGGFVTQLVAFLAFSRERSVERAVIFCAFLAGAAFCVTMLIGVNVYGE